MWLDYNILYLTNMLTGADIFLSPVQPMYLSSSL